jgi:hypothetical protein
VTHHGVSLITSAKSIQAQQGDQPLHATICNSVLQAQSSRGGTLSPTTSRRVEHQVSPALSRRTPLATTPKTSAAPQAFAAGVCVAQTGNSKQNARSNVNQAVHVSKSGVIGSIAALHTDLETNM